MKQDYLWDKTGNDPEIENLEQALAAFRYREIAPPALPAKAVVFEIKKPFFARKIKSLGFAIAAGLALTLLSLGAWLQISHRNAVVEPELTIAPLIEERLPNNFVAADKPKNLIAAEVEVAPRSVKQRIVKPKKAIAASPRRRQIQTAAQISETAPLKLSDEEKYAYDELMRALSIAGSKLKLVKDKVEGSDE